MPLENVKGLVRPKDIAKDVANQKAMDFLKEHAAYTEKKAQEDKPQEGGAEE